MYKFSVNKVRNAGRSPQISFVLFILVILMTAFILIPIFYLGISSIMTAGSDVSIRDVLESPQEYPEMRWMVLLSQGGSSVLLFIIAPLFYLYKIEKLSFGSINSGGLQRPAQVVGLTIAIVFTAMPLISVLVAWNEGWQFPEGLQEWARSYEEQTKVLTEYLTDFSGFGYFLATFVVVALVAGIGEEIVFRGILQQQFFGIFKNHHMAIWLAAFVFSFIHFQFFGLVPRLVLGALFGYLYVWSGNIWAPIAAHITNNGMTVIAMYLHHSGTTDFNVNSSEPMQTGPVMVSTLFCAALIFYYRKITENKALPDG